MKAITQAKNPDLRAAGAALLRAAELARQTAIQTGTNIVVMKDGRLTRISAAELRRTTTPATRKSA